ncbi:MAG: M56 family metallopeptidase [Prevotella sp.]|nr:M56 family metallopeptidase [Prevotella sp.]
MTQFLIYDLKAALLTAVFYVFWRLLLSKDTFHSLNRMVLLSTAVLSFVLPLCVITVHRPAPVTGQTAVYVDGLRPLGVVEGGAGWGTTVAVLFFAVMGLRLLYVAVSYWKLHRFIASCERFTQADGTILAVTDRAGISPFSWMKTVVLPRSDYEQPDMAVITHEKGHMRRGHSWDVLLMEVVCAVEWFNPVVWMMRQDLRAIHEFEADEDVIEKGFNAHEYLDMLVMKASACGAYSMANGITNSTLKQRIQMMMKQKSYRWSRAKVLYVIPIAALSLACTSRTVNDTQPEADATEQLAAADGEETIYIVDGQVTDRETVEQMDPQTIKSVDVFKNEQAKANFPGGKDADAVVVVRTQGVTAADSRKEEEPLADVMETKQEEPAAVSQPKEERVFDVVDEMPVFPGGDLALMDYLNANAVYPKAAQERGASGRVLVSFVVEKDGSIDKVRVVRPVDPALDAEAVRIVRMMPNWQPGRQAGRPVAVQYSVPVMFRLQ